ncbi:MAG: hypothetical protein WCT49_01670 [Candidatus Paceibacterota bacterium]
MAKEFRVPIGTPNLSEANPACGGVRAIKQKVNGQRKKELSKNNIDR